MSLIWKSLSIRPKKATLIMMMLMSIPLSALYIPLPQLFVIRCALALLEERNDCRCPSIFHILTKIASKSCKVIIDSDCCINDMSSMVIDKIGSATIFHPQPCKVFWINNTTQKVRQKILVSQIIIHTRTTSSAMLLPWTCCFHRCLFLRFSLVN